MVRTVRPPKAAPSADRNADEQSVCYLVRYTITPKDPERATVVGHVIVEDFSDIDKVFDLLSNAIKPSGGKVNVSHRRIPFASEVALIGICSHHGYQGQVLVCPTCGEIAPDPVQGLNHVRALKKRLGG